MIKLVRLLKRKPGMSRDDFIAHYELRHVPLILQLTATAHDYRRNYPRPQCDPATAEPVPEYDVITEMWFRNEGAYKAFAALTSVPEVQAQLTLEEERFLDRTRSCTFIVDEFVTETANPALGA